MLLLLLLLLSKYFINGSVEDKGEKEQAGLVINRSLEKEMKA